MAAYHEKRTVEWGHWGIDFMDPNPNRDQNYGLVVGSVSFPVGARGPIDGDKAKYRAMCDAWIVSRSLPEGWRAR